MDFRQPARVRHAPTQQLTNTHKQSQILFHRLPQPFGEARRCHQVLCPSLLLPRPQERSGHSALLEPPVLSQGHADHPLPHLMSSQGTGWPPRASPAPLCSCSRTHLSGAQTWRVMEEVDNAFLRCVEEGSGHGVVLSISAEKLSGKNRELEAADLSCPVAEKLQTWGHTCQRGGSSGQQVHQCHAWVSISA